MNSRLQRRQQHDFLVGLPRPLKAIIGAYRSISRLRCAYREESLDPFQFVDVKLLVLFIGIHWGHNVADDFDLAKVKGVQGILPLLDIHRNYLRDRPSMLRDDHWLPLSLDFVNNPETLRLELPSRHRPHRRPPLWSSHYGHNSPTRLRPSDSS